MGITEIPKGFKSLLPEEAKRREKIVSVAEKILNLWGYELLFPPTVEFLSTFKVVDERFEEIAFKIVDRETGRLMALRPDFTPQVSRIVASSFKYEEPPFRFYYKGKVFRDLRSREVFQVGFELIGVKEPEADAEVVSIVVNILRKLNLKSFQIDIGHSEFVDGALEELKIPNKNEFLKLLTSKDLSGVEIFTQKYGIQNERKEKLIALLDLYGKEEVLKRAKEIFKNEKSRKAIKELEEIYEVIKSYGFGDKIIFDLSERKGMKYHTSITYEVFHPLLGFSFAFGGRYDQLIKKFGRDLPATGIAINVDALQLLLEKKGTFKEERKDFYIVDLKKERKLAYEVAKELREKGFTVARDIIKREAKTSVKVAFQKGYKFVLVLNREISPAHLLYLSPTKWVPVSEKNISQSVVELTSNSSIKE